MEVQVPYLCAIVKPICHSAPIQPFASMNATMRIRATIMTPTIWGMLNPRMRSDAPPAQTLMHKLKDIVSVTARSWMVA